MTLLAVLTIQLLWREMVRADPVLQHWEFFMSMTDAPVLVPKAVAS